MSTLKDRFLERVNEQVAQADAALKKRYIEATPINLSTKHFGTSVILSEYDMWSDDERGNMALMEVLEMYGIDLEEEPIAVTCTGGYTYMVRRVQAPE